ncbi:MAG: hypothetical protein ABR963_07320 [Acidimicrobiales bacterium]
MEYFNPLTSVPPEDPNDWTDEQWIDWLKATDAEAGPTGEFPVATVGSRIARSPAGQVLGQAMLGLAQAIYGPKDEEQVLIVEGVGEPEDDEPFNVQLDFEHPERSQIVFRGDSDSSHG